MNYPAVVPWNWIKKNWVKHSCGQAEARPWGLYRTVDGKFGNSHWCALRHLVVKLPCGVSLARRYPHC